VSSFPLQQRKENTHHRFVSIKVDAETIYVSIRDEDRSRKTCSSVLLYNPKGILQKTFTVETKKKKPFAPRGMAIHNSLLYVCDLNNHSVVVLDKKNGTYQTEWGAKVN